MERLQKILSQAGIASRRAAEGLIETGRVSVNGKVITELGTRADPTRDDIRVDGRRVRQPDQHIYLVLNKPRGFITTRNDPQGRRTVMDLAPKVPGLFPVGRLDVATEGLIFLTNDGAFAERMAHPRFEVPRTYRAKVRGIPEVATLQRMRRGIRVDGDRLAVDEVRVISAENHAWIEVTLHEGKHHEIRRLLAALGHPVSKLSRIRIGCVTDHGLATGALRELTARELRELQRAPSATRPTRPARPARPVRRPHAPAKGAAQRQHPPAAAPKRRTAKGATSRRRKA